MNGHLDKLQLLDLNNTEQDLLFRDEKQIRFHYKERN